MNTRVVHVDANSPSEAVVREAADLLSSGGLVAFPTETVYGLGALAFDDAALARLFEAKGRPATDPVIVHIASADNLDAVTCELPALARTLASRFWPGPLTLVVPKHPDLPAAVTAGLPSVGVRVPSHPVAQALLRVAMVPVAAPSANRFSRPSPTHADHVLQDLNGAIDLVLDAGPTLVGVESTVLDLTVDPPLVRRPGGISVEQLREVVPDLQFSSHVSSVQRPQLSPGQLLRHYAPRARLTLYLGDSRTVAERLAADARTLAANGSRVGILAPEEDLMAVAPALVPLAVSGRVRFSNYGARHDVVRAARELFDALRRLDDEGVDEILASAPEPRDIGLAIVDRLTRAAEGRIKRS